MTVSNSSVLLYCWPSETRAYTQTKCTEMWENANFVHFMGLVQWRRREWRQQIRTLFCPYLRHVAHMPKVALIIILRWCGQCAALVENNVFPNPLCPYSDCKTSSSPLSFWPLNVAKLATILTQRRKLRRIARIPYSMLKIQVDTCCVAQRTHMLCFPISSLLYSPLCRL